MRLAVVALLLLAGCGGSGASDFRTHRVEEAAFSIATPAEWKTLDRLDSEAVDEFAVRNPGLAAYVRPLIENDLIKLISFDPETEDAFATNLNVGVVAIPPSMTFERWIDANLADTQRALDTRVSVSRKIRLPAGRAARLTYSYEMRASDGHARAVHVDQYLLMHQARGYVLTYTTLPELRPRYLPTFAKSARSLQLG